MTSSTPSADQPRVATLLKSMRDDRMMNSDDTRISVRLSLKLRMSRVCTPGILASQMPMTVTASRPDSCISISARAKMAVTTAMAEKFCKKGGIQVTAENAKPQPGEECAREGQ